MSCFLCVLVYVLAVRSTVAQNFPPCFVCFDNGESFITNPETTISLPPETELSGATCEQLRFAGEVALLIPESACV